jgi:hypothetical protein
MHGSCTVWRTYLFPLVFLFNRGEKSAEVEFTEQLAHPPTRARDIVNGETVGTSGQRFQVKTQVQAQAVKIYRIDY